MPKPPPGWIARAHEAASLAGLPAADVARLLVGAGLQAMRDEQAVFARGDTAHAVFVVLSGGVRISTLGASGKRITVEIFQAGALFGEIAAIDDGPRTADAAAMGPTELVSLPAVVFREVLRQSAPLANAVLHQTIARLRWTYTLLEDASLRPIEARLARQVLFLMDLGATSGAQIRIQARMHQDELADLLGVTTRSIINVLNKWRAEDLVRFDGRTAQLTVLDVDRLRSLTKD